MQIIEIFINELSLEDKDYTNENISQEMSHFSEILSFIAQKIREYEKIELFVNLEGLKKQEFFDHLEVYEEYLNKDTIRNIKQRIDKSKNWQDSEYKQHRGEDVFYCFDLETDTFELVTYSSLAEIAHRKIAQPATQFLLINFSNSRFQHNKFLSILKKSYNQLPELTHIPQIDTLKELKTWLRLEIDIRNVIEESSKFEEIKTQFIQFNFDFEQWNPTENYLPLAKISNLLVADDWGSFRAALRKNAQEKIAIIGTIAKQVALINGYHYNEVISKLNSNAGQIRQIYSAGKNKNKIYLSVDFETGGYEVCDFLGTHLGEYWFDGTQAQNDKPQDHSISIK